MTYRSRFLFVVGFVVAAGTVLSLDAFGASFWTSVQDAAAQEGTWTSILPPLIAIAMALAVRRVIPALFLGVWLGAWLVNDLSVVGLWRGLLDSFQVYVLQAVVDADRSAIILFTLMIGGMVGIVSRSGGMIGVVNHIVKWATDPRRGQLATAVLGVVIFFDDYANTLVVGNTMRSVTDRLHVSREKLAYLVDCTAAPVACIALVTTWIGYEVGLIGQAVSNLEGLSDASPYGLFLHTIPYSFYPILALLFVFLVAGLGRDFGAMRAAEVRARTTGAVLRPGAQVDEAAMTRGEMLPKEGKPTRSVNAILPIIVLVGGVIIGLYVSGRDPSQDQGLREIIGNADSYKALMWASLLGALMAGLLALSQRILTLQETVEAWYGGVRSMLFAMIILVLAWSLSDITEVLGTAHFLKRALGDALLPALLPALVFVLAAATAFATGSSWGTMGILMPLVIPLVWAVLQSNNMNDPAHLHILYSSIAAILTGAVWGDHCSPISDTTVLSSMASGCDHVDHVRTQLPYALVVGVVCIVLVSIPVGFGLPWWAGLSIGALTLFAVIRFVGRPVDDTPAGWVSTDQA